MNIHFCINVLEKIFSIGTSCFLHHAAVILNNISSSECDMATKTQTYRGSR